MCGDFNTVRFPTEKSEGTKITRVMTDFSDFIDVDLYWGNYTWKKGDRHTIAARLDRFLLRNGTQFSLYQAKYTQ